MTTFKAKIGASDINWWDGLTRTAQRPTSTGGTLSFPRVGNVVDVLQVYGDGITPSYGALSRAVGLLGNSTVTLELAPGAWPVDANMTIPATVSLRLAGGAYFDVGTGITLTINGQIFPESSTWYSGAGTVTVSGSKVNLMSNLASDTGADYVNCKIPATGATSRSVYDRLIEGFISVKDFGAVGNGATDDTAAIDAADTAALGTLYFPKGVYYIPSNITISRDCIFADGAKIKVHTGATVTFWGKIHAGDREIFVDDGGSIFLDDSPNEYNLSWFDAGGGNWINQRWNFARRAMVSFNAKTVRIPKPYDGQGGTYKSIGSTRIFWGFNGEFLFEDAQNYCEVYVDGEFKTDINTTNFFRFYSASKPESINFYGDINILVPSGTTVGCGLRITTGARICFFGTVSINGCTDNICIGGTDQVAPCGQIFFDHINSAYFSNSAVSIYGKATHTCQHVYIRQLEAQACTATGKKALTIEGFVRNVTIENVEYNRNVNAAGWVVQDIDTVVYVASTDDNTSDNDFLGSITINQVCHAQTGNGTQVVKITSTGAALSLNRIQNVVIRQVEGFSGGATADLNYCVRCVIEMPYNNGSITFGANTAYLSLISNGGISTYTDNGGANSTNLWNNFGTVTRGGGTLPAANLLYPLGAILRNTNDGKIYVRVAQTGTAATDFIALN